MMTAQLKKEWLISFAGWSAFIFFMSATYVLYDWAMPPADEINNRPWWALQEWGIWYLLTPVVFRLLTQHHEANRLTKQKFICILALMLCISMTYQAIFDFWVLCDAIPYTMLYFAPSHPLVLFVLSYLWHTFLRTEQSLHHNTLEVETGSTMARLRFSDITHINSASNYVELHTEQHHYLKRITLKQIEQQLPDTQFIRTHRSHLVNLDYVERIHIKPSGSGLVLLKSGQSVALSKAFKPVLRAKLKNVA
ncbi:LytR/AlgR family response regulator transcription factor [Pseudoalteromonas umbrosa]|uniref:LytR/AlgR family response regulator transcription factor n=1 Tax=Pseudoalteromonas umbrosa TaxID=3048489 RepID=UPI0024C31FE6|nr:LytTR family DNA-binding domain-containing protein [Pseudoalteromonas sp. B95]MDK1290323.1 LytTR family DNA-binding domain-containing protein [Pseudoalteromonas sp. B95]